MIRAAHSIATSGSAQKKRSAQKTVHHPMKKTRHESHPTPTKPLKLRKKYPRMHKTPLHEADARKHQESRVDPFDLEGMNKVVEDITNMQQELPPQIWDQWLWESDLNEPPDSISLLNRCQLLGLIICRYRAARQDPWTSKITLSPSRLIVVDKPPSSMTLRELRDSMSNLVLLWGKDIHSRTTIIQPGHIHIYLDACFHRLGELSWATWPCGSQVRWAHVTSLSKHELRQLWSKHKHAAKSNRRHTVYTHSDTLSTHLHSH